MAVSSTLTFDLATAPRRPAEADVVNGEKSNATPTVPPEMPSAEEFMQMARQIVAAGRMIPLVRASITFSGGTPSVQSFASARSDLLVGDIVLTDNGAGDTTVTIPTSKFPAATTAPAAVLNDATGTNRSPSAEPYSSTGVRGARVRTANSAGALTDTAFTVTIY